MARIRSIKPSFFRSRSLARCSIPARITFAGLWSEADDAGRGIADARILKGAIWPLDDAIQAQDVEDHLTELSREHIAFYEVDGDRYYIVKNWEEHQSAAFRRSPPVHPAPPPVKKRASRKIPHAPECANVLEGEGNKEGSKERKREGESAAPEAPTPPPPRKPTTLPADWTPTEPYDRADFAKFAAYCRANAVKASDWQARYDLWRMRDGPIPPPANGAPPRKPCPDCNDSTWTGEEDDEGNAIACPTCRPQPPPNATKPVVSGSTP